MTPPSGYPGSGHPRARDVGRKSHTSKLGRLVSVRILTKTGVRRYKVRQSRLATEYRKVYTAEPISKGTFGVRKGTRLFVPQRKVLEVMVYGLARQKVSTRYAFLPERDWVFHLRPRTNPERAIEEILKRLSENRIIVVDTEEGGYRPFTVAAQVVDATDRDVLTLKALPEAVQKKIDELDWKEPK